MLDLAGNTINRKLTSATPNGYVIMVEGDLTIKDSGSGGTITGSAVTKIGAISGATVTLPSSSCQIEFVKSGETVVSSAFIQASETPYVLETQQGAGAVLVRAIED